MTKRLHPIQKIQRELCDPAACRGGGTATNDHRIIARHVKPLLDAIWDDHTICRDMDEEGQCRICRLHAEWSAKL